MRDGAELQNVSAICHFSVSALRCDRRLKPSRGREWGRPQHRRRLTPRSAAQASPGSPAPTRQLLQASGTVSLRPQDQLHAGRDPHGSSFLAQCELRGARVQALQVWPTFQTQAQLKHFANARPPRTHLDPRISALKEWFGPGQRGSVPEHLPGMPEAPGSIPSTAKSKTNTTSCSGALVCGFSAQLWKGSFWAPPPPWPGPGGARLGTEVPGNGGLDSHTCPARATPSTLPLLGHPLCATHIALGGRGD